MSLAPGRTLSHYRLVEQIGEGGMGVVWRATDTSLGRDVAIKVLPEAVANDPERMARFEREARLLAPSLSPDATRVIYARIEHNGPIQLWMSAVAGGAPVRLVGGSADSDFAGSWSPDGNWFVYWHNTQDGKVSLNKVKTTGQAEPEVVKADVSRTGQWVPVWSPSGEWILHDDGGVKLISPDGKTTREVSTKSALAYAFSTDGKTIYGIRQVAGEDHLNLFSMSIAGGAEKTIGSLGSEYRPATGLTPALRLSLSPDGKSLTYSTVKSTSNLWLMEGLDTVTLP